MNHLVSRVVSLHGCRGAWVYNNGKFSSIYPVEKRDKVADTLMDFSDDVGIPSDLRADLAPELTGKRKPFQDEIRRLRVKLTFSEAERKNQNHRAELEIRELKRHWRRKMVQRQVPRRLWDYGLVYQANIMSRTVHGDGFTTGYEEITGNTPDISEWVDFDFYDLVWYFHGTHPGIAEDDRRLGRWLGVSHRIGSALSYWILTPSGKVISRSIVQHVTQDHYLDMDVKARIDEFNKEVKERLKDDNFMNKDLAFYYLDDDLYDPAYGDELTTLTDDEYGSMIMDDKLDVDDIDDDAFDKYLGATIYRDDGTGDVKQGRT